MTHSLPFLLVFAVFVGGRARQILTFETPPFFSVGQEVRKGGRLV